MMLRALILGFLIICNLFLIFTTPKALLTDLSRLLYVLILVEEALFVFLYVKNKVSAKMGYAMNFFSLIFLLTYTEVFHETGDIIFSI